MAWEVQGAHVLRDLSWESTPLAMAPPRQCKGSQAFLGQWTVLRGQVEADFTLLEVWCDALGHWKAAGEMERPSSTLSSEAFPSLRTEGVRESPLQLR